MYGMKKDRLQLLPHDLAWKDDFLTEKHRIAAALDDWSVLIEHVGSTAIPTIHAKPILDIAILCGEKGIEPVAQALLGLGYDYRGQFGEEPGHYYAVLDKNNVRLCQTHIFTEANADWHAKLRFRDVLRQNPELAHEYDDYKQRLAKVAANKSEYAEIKTRWVDTFILKVMRAAVDG
ncbi:MAG: hypothetical protein QOH49_1736 [Acidobacteriota bacterium]|jgi:GrpB-like predicted nucleotidyltransferase (UPF0157 family)|nr:hypothetical protein [Acidobacteriota bacterium]